MLEAHIPPEPGIKSVSNCKAMQVTFSDFSLKCFGFEDLSVVDKLNFCMFYLTPFPVNVLSIIFQLSTLGLGPSPDSCE